MVMYTIYDNIRLFWISYYHRFRRTYAYGLFWNILDNWDSDYGNIVRNGSHIVTSLFKKALLILFLDGAVVW